MKYEALVKKYKLNEPIESGCYKTYGCSIFAALIVRFICILHGLVLLLVVNIKYETEILGFFLLVLVSMLLEGTYCVIYRQGRESKYFSLATMFYIIAVVPPMWILYFKRLQYVFIRLFNDDEEKPEFTDFVIEFRTNITNFEEQDEKLYRINENTFMFILILCRWFLPKEDLSIEQLYSLLVHSISIAADAHEMFFSCDTLKILKRIPNLSRYDGYNFQVFYFPTYVLMAWTTALPLFVLNLVTESYVDLRFRPNTNRYIEKLFGNFYWKYITSMVLVDGTFFLLRTVSIIIYQVISLQNIFYISKNIIQIIVQVYRILGKVYFPEDNDLREQNIRIQNVNKPIIPGIETYNILNERGADKSKKTSGGKKT